MILKNKTPSNGHTLPTIHMPDRISLIYINEIKTYLFIDLFFRNEINLLI